MTNHTQVGVAFRALPKWMVTVKLLAKLNRTMASFLQVISRPSAMTHVGAAASVSDYTVIVTSRNDVQCHAMPHTEVLCGVRQ